MYRDVPHDLSEGHRAMRKAVLACLETSSLANPATQVRRMTRLGLLHKAVHNRAAITIPSHVQYKSSSATRNISICLNSLVSRLHEILAKFSFWPRKINDWNSLPPNILEIDPTDNFKPASNAFFYLIWLIR